MKAIESRSPVDQCLRFRLQDEDGWRVGRTVNISRSGLLFATFEQIEVGTVLEVDLGRVEKSRRQPLRHGMVVRRVLMAWPDVTTLVAIRFLENSVRTGEEMRERVAG